MFCRISDPKKHLELSVRFKLKPIFLDVSQAFDRVWHDGLLHKLSRILPCVFCAVLFMHILLIGSLSLLTAQLPLTTVTFSLAYHRAVSHIGPLLYILFTADVPSSAQVLVSMFADDTDFSHS